MIKKTLCFSNPAYLSLRDAQLVIRLPEVEKAEILSEDFKKANEITRPIEDIGVVVLVLLFTIGRVYLEIYQVLSETGRELHQTTC
jgi:hypothetical protein